MSSTLPKPRTPQPRPIAAMLALAGLLPAQGYVTEPVATPPGLDAQIGGVAIGEDGRVAICCHRGEVYIHDPEDGSWTLFADGLQEPLGLIWEGPSNLVVMQRPELTRLMDIDRDGTADLYQTLCDDFGMSGNYHEFAFGPARGPDDRYYIALNVASNGAGIRDEVRGRLEPLARPGRMYSVVPYRGWVLAIDPRTGRAEPYASGFRSPDGIAWSPDGQLFITDNQGDWLGTSKLFAVEPGGFHGHVSSLVWQDGWDRGDPLKIPPRELDEMRVRAAVLFPHGLVANSPTQPAWIPDNGGPFAGQMLVGEMNRPRILRILRDDVAGHVQGATVTHLDGGKLPGGVHRLAFAPDGSLWTGHTALSWAGGKGLARTRWTGDEPPLAIESVHLDDDGFTFTFTRPVDLMSMLLEDFDSTVTVRRYWYSYHRPYGSDQMGVRKVPVTELTADGDMKTLHVKLEDLRPGRVHEFTFGALQSLDGEQTLEHRLVCYNLNWLRDGSTARPQWEPAEPLQLGPVEPIAFSGRADLQAETAQHISGPQVHAEHRGARGDGYVDYQAPSGELIAWTLRLDAPARLRATLRYALGGGPPRPLRVLVNGEPVGEFAGPATGGWDSWDDTAIDLDLPAGEVTLTLASFGKSGPNVDELRLTPRTP